MTDDRQLTPQTRALLSNDGATRIAALAKNVRVSYPQLENVLERMQEIFDHENGEAEHMTLVAASGNGKTTTIRCFLDLHKANDKPEHRTITVPVLYINAPPSADPRRFLTRILDKLGASYRATATLAHLESQAMRLMESVGVRVLVVDEMQHVEAGHRDRRRESLNLLKAIGNELEISIIAVGLPSFLYSLQDDAQLARRFEPWALPTWSSDRDGRRLLTTIEQTLPLHHASRLAGVAVADRIFQESEGTFAEIVRYVRLAAKAAITTEREMIDIKLLDTLKWVRPSVRRDRLAQQLGIAPQTRPLPKPKATRRRPGKKTGRRGFDSGVTLAGGLTGHLWPAHPKPKPDELLSSWVGRVAAANGAPTLHTFCHLEWPHRQLWTRDLDAMAPSDVVDRMAARTATPIDMARATTLLGYEGVLVERVVVTSASRWIMRLGVYHRTRRRNGLQWCPACLQDDVEPYYRRIWRTALATCCPAHGILLVDSCQDCGSPAVPHRGRDPCCHICSADRRHSPTAQADGAVLVFQHLAERILAGAPVWFPDHHGLHPLAYFALLHQLMAGLSTSPRAARLREATARAVGGDPTPPHVGDDRVIEGIRTVDRHRLMGLTARLLQGWPWRFIDVCMTAGFWWSWVVKDRPKRELPYVLFDAARRYLHRSYELDVVGR